VIVGRVHLDCDCDCCDCDLDGRRVESRRQLGRLKWKHTSFDTHRPLS
jgi:hypothetical protein